MYSKLMSVMVLAAMAGGAQAQFFTDDFQSGAKPEWSDTTTETSPNGTKFLGRFGDKTLDLSLTGLGTHDGVLIELRLFIINTMDGGEPFTFSEVGGATFLNTTFSNAAGALQFFPDNIGGSLHAPQTGAAATGVSVLGYNPINGNDLAGAAYDLAFSFAHVADAMTFRINASGLQGIGDESWGIDDVKVTLRGVPTPGTAALLAMAGLTGARRRRS